MLNSEGLGKGDFYIKQILQLFEKKIGINKIWVNQTLKFVMTILKIIHILILVMDVILEFSDLVAM